MVANVEKWIIVIFITSLFLLVSDAVGAGKLMTPGRYKAELKYGLMLPDYCGYNYFNRKGPKYHVSRELCGVGTNHFCKGLIELYKARDAKKKKYKVIHYKQAKGHAEYTKRWIAKYPRCPLHKDVANVLMEANMMLGMWGKK